MEVGLRMQSARLSPTKPPLTGNISVSYPFGLITFLESYIQFEFKIPELFDDLMSKDVVTKYELKYSDIDCVKRGYKYVRIFHHQANMSKFIYISGVAFSGSIFKQISSIVRENNLPITIDTKIAPFL